MGASEGAVGVVDGTDIIRPILARMSIKANDEGLAGVLPVTGADLGASYSPVLWRMPQPDFGFSGI